MPDGALIGVGGYVSFVALLCAAVGLTFFGGTTRETLGDKETLLGLFLIGSAMLLHGGFAALLGSSPWANFTGSVRAYAPLPDEIHEERWAWFALYDLGYPPKESIIDPVTGTLVPYRDFTISWTKQNPVPEAIFETDEAYWVSCVYRTWDLKSFSLDAAATPQARARGRTSVHWTAAPESPLWHLLEGMAGVFAIVVACVVYFRTPKPQPRSSRLNPMSLRW